MSPERSLSPLAPKKNLPITFRAGLALRLLARKFHRAAHYLNALGGNMLFKPRADDIYIASYPRSGTTWLQMILHQLRTDGSLEFTHISEVIPFFERSLNRGRNLDILPSPRVFKTHLRHHQCPQLGKYIYVHRDGKDVLWSHYHFSRSHLNYKGSFDLFFKQFLEGKIGSGCWFQHVKEWEAHARDPNCLFLEYEQLSNDLAGWLPRIADFCGIVISTDEYPRILERCSFQYMKEHEGKFDHATEILWELGLQHGHFIRQGKVGSWKDRFNEAQVGQFDEAARAARLPDKRGTIKNVRDFVLGKSTARP